MTTLGELLRESEPLVERRPFFMPRAKSAAKDAKTSTKEKTVPFPAPHFSIRDEQVRMLVQQLFFRHTVGPVRSIGFTALEDETPTAHLCLDVAKALVDEGKYEVGLIDACLSAPPIHEELQIPAPAGLQGTWAVAPRLWLAPCESWGPQNGLQPTDQNLERLRELTTDFDFSIVNCPPVSWLTARIGHSCDGLVLVLSANKTRRLVATQIKQQLDKAQVPILGTVLAERRFPVPNRLYRSL